MEKKEYTEVENKIIGVLDLIKPYLQSDGGDLEFIRYEENYVYIKLTGACHGCDFAENTINDVILESIKTEVPEVEGVIAVPL